MMLISKRHFQGPSAFTDSEAGSVGLALRRCERVLEEVTRCDRVYTAALGSAAAPHFHAHMVPVYKDAEGSVGQPAQSVSGSPFDVFLQEKLAKEGKLPDADATQCLAVAQAFAAAMADGSTSGSVSAAAPPAKRIRVDGRGRRCRAVLFDLDNTLVQTAAIDRAAIQTAAASVVSEHETRALGARFADLLREEPFPPAGSFASVDDWRVSLWDRAIGQKDAALARGAHRKWMSERLTQFKFSAEVQAMLERLRAAGYSTGILTNGHADVQRSKLEACDAARFFENKKIVVAGDYSEQKPHASIFLTACLALGEPAEATVMVGDDYDADIAGAMNAHLLSAVWVHAEKKGPLGKPQPEFTISSVLDIEDVLKQIN